MLPLTCLQQQAQRLCLLAVQGLAERLLTLDSPPLPVEGGPKAVRLSTLGCAILSHLLGLSHVRSTPVHTCVCLLDLDSRSVCC